MSSSSTPGPDLVGAKSLSKILNTTGADAPLILIVTEGGLTAVSTDWGVDDVILVTAGPAEVDARIRLAVGRKSQDQGSSRIQTSGISIDESSYSAKVHGKAARPDVQGVPAAALLRDTSVAGLHP